jgi:phage anti-repressor protein
MTNANHHDANPSLSGTDGLIPVFNADIGGILQPAVDARELHHFLGVKRDFSTWIKRRMTECGLVEDSDYLLTKMGEQLPSGTKYRFEYYLKLDVAKELAMVEKNAKGREARRYFIDCERYLMTQWQGQASLPQPEGLVMSDAEAADDFPLFSDVDYLSTGIKQRALFVFCTEYVPLLSEPGLSAAEVRLRWQALEAYFNQLSDSLAAGVDGVVGQTQGGRQAKKKAVVAFIAKWWPRGARRVPEPGDTEGGLYGKP